MPEITLPGLRETGNGPSEQEYKMLVEFRKGEKVLVWSHEGTHEECEKSWHDFLLADTPDWVILS